MMLEVVEVLRVVGWLLVIGAGLTVLLGYTGLMAYVIGNRYNTGVNDAWREHLEKVDAVYDRGIKKSRLEVLDGGNDGDKDE